MKVEFQDGKYRLWIAGATEGKVEISFQDKRTDTIIMGIFTLEEIIKHFVGIPSVERIDFKT